MFETNETIQLEKHRYRIINQIGAGGQSRVWEVKRDDGKPFALRTVNLLSQNNRREVFRHHSEVVDLVERAWEELRFLQDLGQEARQHHIVTVLDSGAFTHPHYPDQSLPIMILALFEHDMSHYINSVQGKRFDAFDCFRWLRQVAIALQYVHQRHTDAQPYVHRDVKPDNIVLDQQGNAALTDFGIVKAMIGVGTRSVVASPYYCAPEQRLAWFRNQQGHKQYMITPAVDIYALAISLVELLIGGIRAQTQLTPHLIDQHETQLPTGKGASHPIVGELGKIGGLTTKECEQLTQKLFELLADSLSANRGNTILFGSACALPDREWIVNRFVEVMQQMLKPLPADRPDASTVRAWADQLQQAMQPRLHRLALRATSSMLTIGEACSLTLTISGSGLPKHYAWLMVLLDGKALEQVLPSSDGIISDQARLRFQVPLPEVVGEYRITVQADVLGQHHQDSLVCTVDYRAEDLWQMGKQEQALQRQLRQTWLHEFQQSFLTPPTLSRLCDLRDAYARLQAFHAQDESLHIAMAELESLACLKPSPNLRFSDEIPEMLSIPAGRFIMGCLDERDDVEGGCYSDEKPAHEVQLKGFELGRYPVTVGQFRAFVKATGYRTTAETDGGAFVWVAEKKSLLGQVKQEAQWKQVEEAYWDSPFFKQSEQHPVTCVSWHDAKAYVEWLNQHTEQQLGIKPHYRLPSEAEWEYAARGGEGKQAYPWGNQASSEHACYGFRQVGTVAVGQYPANGFGLHDMHGNVWEWQEDCWHDSYADAPEDGSAWITGSSAIRVLRGGSWAILPRSLRSAGRSRGGPAYRNSILGFRLARST